MQQQPPIDPAVADYVAGAPVAAILARHALNAATLYRRLARAGVPPRQVHRQHPGVPVYDEAGAPFAGSVSEAARLLGCRPNNLIQSRLAPHRDGYILTGRPGRRRQRREAPDAQ